jgi:ABC-type nitrate/sulfonate/bicarbonate transport system permease component
VSRRALLLGLEIAVPVALLALWWTLSAGSDSFYFPPLSDTVERFRELWLFDRLGSDVLPSVLRLFAGFAIASALGVVAGLALGLFPTLRQVSSPVVEFMRAIPPTALLPFAILVLGVGDGMKVFIIALTCFFPVLLNTITGVAGVDPVLRDTSQVYGLPRAAYVRSVVLPASLPHIFAGMRTSLSIALILMVVSEMVASSNGLGYFVVESQRSFAIADMWAGILLIGLLGYLLNLVFVLVERRVLRWHREARGSALR